MSGGVDSSVAALLLQQQGYDVHGATFCLWPPSDLHHTLDDAVQDAKKVCVQLGIPHNVFYFERPFQEIVVEDFVRCYQNGLTPNPCVVCNRQIKFGIFFGKAMEMGFDYIATGHYAQIRLEDGIHRLVRAVDVQKDQSYFLYAIRYDALARTLFPLGGYTKPQVREIAQQNALPVHSKRDSQDICFIDRNGYGAFLHSYTGLSAPPGNFVDVHGNILGTHQGIWHYTVGQRKGLGISLGEPAYVLAVRPQDNTVVLGKETQLYISDALVRNFNILLPADQISFPLEGISVKTRSRSQYSDARIERISDDCLKIIFHQPQKAVAPGQSAVFYQEDRVLGGGIFALQ